MRKAERFTLIYMERVGSATMNHYAPRVVRVATANLERLVNKYDVQFVLKGWPAFEDGTLPALVQ